MRARGGYLLLLFPLLVLGPPLAGCGDEEPAGGGGSTSWPDEYGAPPQQLELAESPEGTGGKADGAGVAGPQRAWDTGQYAVWTPTRQWTDVTPEAGLAWGANSGLNWEEKYSAWVASLPKRPAVAGYTTFSITNPQGVTLPAPVLECAEVAIFLRITFAAWYRLPFFLEAADAQGRIFLGHFGFRRANGNIYNSSPTYQTLYQDHTATWRTGQPWPSDSRLASRGLYGGGDEVSFLPQVDGKPALAGAYFDALFLDKRVGHFLLVALAWFGSIHLADPANTYNLKPEAIRPGDVLLERWQRKGIGHTIPVMQVEHLEEDRFEVAIATGSMPRRQPVWEEGNDVVWYFTASEMGGPGTNSDGDAYAALGGGLKRWRSALRSGSQYKNSYMPEDQANWINSNNLEAIAARPARFQQLLGEMTPEVARDIALSRIASERAKLMDHPSSCSSRTRREDAFEDLYEVMTEHFGMDQNAIDATYRELDDYVFAELEYNKSRSCCWNSTTRAMYEIIMAYNRELQEQAEIDGQCVEPVVFKGRDRGAAGDGFQLFRQYAESIGRGSEWVAWSQDEPCPQAQTVNDIEVEHAWTPWCEIDHEGGGNGSGATCAGHQTIGQARTLTPGQLVQGRVCSGDSNWYAVELGRNARLAVVLRFSHAEGDLDLELTNASGIVLGQSAGTSNVESITLDLARGSYRIHVYGYSGAQASYTLKAELQ